MLPPQIEELVARLGGRRRAAIAGVGLATVVVVLGLSHWATRPTWVPAFANLPLEAVGTVTERLDEEAIPYRLEGAGAQILVQTSDLARARVALAQEGMPETGRPGLELFDQPSWGMTDFAQRINYRRALEGELERTISKMGGVEAAKVHLAMSETSSFRVQDRPVEASVVLRLRNGQPAAGDVVQGIQHLVASSVDGLESGNVTVVDDTGRMLSMPDEPGSFGALTSRQLSIQREVESYLERKAEQIVSQVVGPGNARVQVSASINYDRVERTTETLDPERQVIAQEESAEIIPGPEGGAGSRNNSIAYENSRSMESYVSGVGDVKRMTVAVLVNHRVAGTADAPVVEPRSAEELEQIEMLVRNAVGVNDDRGDMVTIASLPFTQMEDPFAEPAPDAWTIAERFQKPALTILALLLTVFVAMRALRTLRPPAPVLATGMGALAAGGEGAVGMLPELGSNEEGALEGALPPGEQTEELERIGPAGPVLPTRRILNTNSRTREQVVNSIEERPDVAARLVRAWMKES